MTSLWIIVFVLACIALYIKWKLPVLIGRSGEKFVSKKLRQLDSSHYKVLDDIMLPSNGHASATQIDHIVVSNYGIFCIETKAYEGWIFGNENQEYWTQVIFRYKKKFYNPLRQNFAHIKAIEVLLGSHRIKMPIISFVAFPDAGKLKVSGTDSVGYAGEIVEKIKGYHSVIYSDAERDEISNLLVSSNIIDKEARKLHNQEVGGIKRY